MREQIAKETIELQYYQSKETIGGMLKKRLSGSQFMRLRELLSVKKIIE